MTQFEKDQLKKRVQAISLSFLIALALMAAKFYAYAITGSSAVLSDALESIINVVASAFALWSILLAAKPPDESHLYGHGKIEYFSAGFEGALIILAALGIFQTAMYQILSPRPLPNLDYGLLVLLSAALVNCLTGLALIRTGKRTKSLVLVADGKHLMTDVYTSVGVVAGLLLVRQTGWLWLDGLTACVVGANIVFMGWRLVRESFAGLMNETDPKLLEEICDILVKNRKDIWIDVHKLRTWKSGSRLHMDFHLILPRDLTLEAGHSEVKELEGIFKAHFGDQTDVLIHADPCIEPECPVCSFDPCDIRLKDTQHQGIWRREEMISEARVAERGIIEENGLERQEHEMASIQGKP